MLTFRPEAQPQAMNVSKRIPYLFTTIVLLALSALVFAMPGRALTISTTYDSSVTASTNSTQIQSAFNTAAQIFQGLYTNPVTINITVYWGATGPFSGGVGLGPSPSPILGTISYPPFPNTPPPPPPTSPA